MFAGGLVWSTGWRSDRLLYGLDPATGAVRFQISLGTFNHFASPSAGGGRLFVAVSSKLAALQISNFPPSSSTSLATSSTPAPAGGTVTLIASVTPAPDGGSVAFTEAGKALPGCGAVALAPGSGRVICRERLAAGTHLLSARYSGDPFFAGSVSSVLRQVVIAGLTISAPRLRPSHFTARHGTVLELTLSRSAKVRVTLFRTRSGRKVRGRCRLGARTGRRCTVSRRARVERFDAKRGANRLPLNLRRLAPGPYVATIIARDAAGLNSTAQVLRFEISRR
jgi:hypothetical protein